MEDEKHFSFHAILYLPSAACNLTIFDFFDKALQMTEFFNVSLVGANSLRIRSSNHYTCCEEKDATISASRGKSG